MIQRRKKSLSADPVDDVLNSAPTMTVTTVSSLPIDFRLAWLGAKSSSKPGELLTMLKTDSLSVDFMLQFALQMPPRLGLPESMKYVEALKRFLDWRYDTCGARLSGFVQKGGLNKNHTLNLLKYGCYTLTFENDLVPQVKHCGGDIAAVPNAAHLTRQHKLVDNYDDWAAALTFAALPPIRLASFFESTKSGPWKVHNYIGKPKVLQQHAQVVFDKWEKDARSAMCANEVDHDISAGVEALRKQARSAAMETAKTMAKTALARKKAKREIDLTAP